jgi:hypothetical protein
MRKQKRARCSEMDLIWGSPLPMFAIWKQSVDITVGSLKEICQLFSWLPICSHVHMNGNRGQYAPCDQVLEHAVNPCAYLENFGAGAHFLRGIRTLSAEKELILAVGIIGDESVCMTMIGSRESSILTCRLFVSIWPTHCSRIRFVIRTEPE